MKLTVISPTMFVRKMNWPPHRTQCCSRRAMEVTVPWPMLP